MSGVLMNSNKFKEYITNKNSLIKSYKNFLNVIAENYCEEDLIPDQKIRSHHHIMNTMNLSSRQVDIMGDIIRSELKPELN